MNPQEIAALFPVKKRLLYFNFASDGPLPIPSRDAASEALHEMSEMGMMAVPKQIAVYENFRGELSRMFNSAPSHFAMVKNTSEGVLLALLAMDIREDENYIIASDAFPTTVCVMRAHCRGEMRAIEFNGSTPVMDQLAKVVDGRTRAIVLDWVHYFSGARLDIPALAEFCRKRGIATVIDGIQGAGALNLDLDSSGIDIFVSGGHKWLLSPQGAAFIYASPAFWERFPRKAFGWLGYNWGDFSDFSINAPLREGAEVFEYGTRSYVAAAACVESLKLFNRWGVEAIEAHNRELTGMFLEEILRKGYETPRPQNGASIVPFRKPGENAAPLHRRLTEEKVAVSLRNGYIRAAFHLVNDKQEVEKFLSLL